MLLVPTEERLPLGNSQHQPLAIDTPFDRLLVAGAPFKRKNKNGIFYDCRCKCGNVTVVNYYPLRRGDVVSCGCRQRETGSINTVRTHGLAKQPLYTIWRGIIRRCTVATCKSYHRYGGRGIIVCEEWYNNPKAFIKWAIDNGWYKGSQID